MTSRSRVQAHGRKRRPDGHGPQAGDRVDTMGTNVYSAKDKDSLHKSLNGEFFLYQILLQRLLDENRPLPAEAKDGLRKFFNPSDPRDEKVMKEFDAEYRCDKAIHWCTRETCVYRILNKTERTQNLDDVVAFAPFIRHRPSSLSTKVN